MRVCQILPLDAGDFDKEVAKMEIDSMDYKEMNEIEVEISNATGDKSSID